MKTPTLIRHAPAGLLAAVLIIMAGVPGAQGATTPLQAQIVPRPITPGDISRYKLPATTEVSGGLRTVGVGVPLYLEAEVNSAIAASDITGVTWLVTNAPVGSTAAITSSPLGTNVPVYEPADQLMYQVAGRALFRPDVAGQYTVLATITTASSGATNVTLAVTAGTYMGKNTCALCHSGGVVAEDMLQSWQTTAHATIFTKGIDGNLGIGAYYSKACLACHTVGYSSNTNVVDGGFDDVMAQLGWKVPTVITNGNWAAVPPALQNLANIQCENCHGPGSEHAMALGNTNLSNWPRLSVTVSSGDCNQCHDAPTHHVKGTEWYNSRHAVVTSYPSGPGREACVICHTANGFIARISGATTTNTAYAAIGCQTCHEPHGMTTPTNNPHLLRTLASVTLKDGTVVTANTAGNGLLCMDCHMARVNGTNYVETTTGNSHFGPHHGPQADMLVGANGITYGKAIPSSAHRSVVPDACVTCHMQTVATTNSAFLNAGGHTFKVGWAGAGTNSPVDLTDACVQCHGPIDSFDFPRQDYDGDGVVEGVQTEVQHLMDKLAMLLPPVNVPKSTLAIDSTWTKQQLRAGYNYTFVQSDGSHGIHNLSYTVGLLKASIADLSGVSVPGGLPDSWAIQYFGSAGNPNAAPNVSAAGDGIPNWVKYALGINPLIPGISVTNGISVGVVWANGNSLSNPYGATNTVQIFTAAEVAFNTDVGKTYQIQGISSLSGGWQNVGAPIAGTGAAISYVTPTRQNVQQFFRVMHNL